MPKTGRQYGDELRELRAAGFDFPADRGYLLRSPGQWSSGLKSAVTRAINELDRDRDTDAEPDQGLSDGEITDIFDDSAGDAFEEFDDIDFFDLDEFEDFIDDESDEYDEDT